MAKSANKKLDLAHISADKYKAKKPLTYEFKRFKFNALNNLSPMPEITIIARNRKAFHDYQVLDHLEAGVSLLGTEVKSACGSTKTGLS